MKPTLSFITLSHHKRFIEDVLMSNFFCYLLQSGHVFISIQIALLGFVYIMQLHYRNDCNITERCTTRSH